MRTRPSIAIAIAVGLAGSSASAQELTRTERDIVAAVEAGAEEKIELLERLVEATAGR